MDRFDSREDAPEWSEQHFEAGRAARIAGKSRDDAPSADLVGEFGRSSWIAGWTDTDTGILADIECERHNETHKGCGKVFDMLTELPMEANLVRDGADPPPQVRPSLESE